MSKQPLPRRNSDLLNIPDEIEDIHRNKSSNPPSQSITSAPRGNNTGYTSTYLGDRVSPDFHDYAYNRRLSETGEKVDSSALQAAAAAKSATSPTIDTLDKAVTSPRSSLSSTASTEAAAAKEPVSPTSSPTVEDPSSHGWGLKPQCFNYEQYKQQLYSKILVERDRVKKNWQEYRFGKGGSDGENPVNSNSNGTGNEHHHQFEHGRHSRQNSIQNPANTSTPTTTSAPAAAPTTTTSHP